MYDAIVVGARVAGSSTAMLLARKGYRVLLVDKATFPSDTLSTHQIQVSGGAVLKRWGLLDKIRATQPGIVTGARLDLGTTALTGTFPALGGVNAHSPGAFCSTNADRWQSEAGLSYVRSFTTKNRGRGWMCPAFAGVRERCIHPGEGPDRHRCRWEALMVASNIRAQVP
jgi:2-polyprenyl-6-methoxyphenol hydroxylase-like FAD-dependent oxidoreductase